MVTADQDPGRDDGGPLGRRFCWSGWEVVGDHPEPTRRTPMRRDTATAGGGVSGAVGPAGQTRDQARCAVSSALDCCGGKASPGLPCQVSMDGVSLVPTLELKGNSVDVHHHPWICISKSWAFRHDECQTLLTAFQSTACRQGSAPPHRW